MILGDSLLKGPSFVRGSSALPAFAHIQDLFSSSYPMPSRRWFPYRTEAFYEACEIWPEGREGPASCRPEGRTRLNTLILTLNPEHLRQEKPPSE